MKIAEEDKKYNRMNTKTRIVAKLNDVRDGNQKEMAVIDCNHWSQPKWCAAKLNGSYKWPLVST